MNDLEMYRESLALCDDKIIDALVERSKIVEKIMAYKEEYGMPILQPQQEAKQALRLEEKLNDNKYREEIMDIFECIRMNSKKIQARKLFDYNIVMIGFMGAGKSTVARTLGEWFDMDIVEMDELISERQGMSIPEIFEKHGEEYFRNLETNLLIELQKASRTIISCGGGAMLNAESAAAARETGAVVLLDQSFAVCYSRIKNDTNRPLVQRNTKEQLETIYHQRDSVYRAHANYIVPAGNTPEESAQRVLDALGLSAVTEETK